MELPVIILLSIFGGMSVIHLVFCFLQNEKLRKITKCFCVLILAVSMVVWHPSAWMIYLGAFFGLIGDLFLLTKKNIKYFVLGTSAFFIGHVFYIAQIITYMFQSGHEVPWFVFAILVAALVILVISIYPITSKLVGRAALLGNLYMPTLLVCMVFALILSSYLNPSWPAIMIAVGYLFFLFSDTFLILTTFKIEVRRHHFYVMLTYLLAEFLITFGLSMTLVLNAIGA